MIYEDQPQMVEAAVEELCVRKASTTLNTEDQLRRAGTFSIREAFAAIDREALIERVRWDKTFRLQHVNPEVGIIEAVLVAAGIIPASAALPRKVRRDD